MKITKLSQQAKNDNRVNVFVDGVFRFSLDILQVTELGIKVGREMSDEDISRLGEESDFGKLYARALEYSLIRPRSVKEMKDYLWRKTRDSRYRSRKTGELKIREGVSAAVADRVLDRIIEKGYVDDGKFAKYWVENRSLRKGASFRKLELEMRVKGINPSTIREAMQNTTRDEKSEITKIIEKKSRRYDDKNKFRAYLIRQGFSFDIVDESLSELDI